MKSNPVFTGAIFLFAVLMVPCYVAAQPAMLWSETYGGADYEYGNSVAQTVDGGFMIAGQMIPPGAGAYKWDVYLVKTDADGNEEWNKHFGTINDKEVATCIQATSDGGFIISGSIIYAATGYNDVYVIKTEVLNPSIQAPGSLKVRLTATNQSASTVVTDVFTRVQLPNGSWYPFGGNWLVGPSTISIPAMDNLSGVIVRNVPAWAPVGSYIYESNIGPYPTIDHHSTDDFQVTH